MLDLARFEDADASTLCPRCGLRGRHRTAGKCIDAFAAIADMSWEKRTPRRSRSKR